jgi:methionyl-tRNA formyltransferase
MDAPRIVFMGTPEFALPTFQALIARYSVVGVVTQPDRPSGRGRAVQPPPVKPLAEARGIPVFQPKSLRPPEAVARLKEWSPDVIITAAIGFILTPEVLAAPTVGTLNVHASLLPRWRGAAPIQAALLAGDAQTGVTIMCTDAGMDTGPILSQQAILIPPRETAATLHDRLAQLGADLLIETLPRWLSGELTPRPQPAEGVTLAGRIRKEDGLIDWNRPALEIDRQIRAFTPWPGAYSFWDERRLKIVAAYPVSADATQPPGTVIERDDLPAAVTGDGLLQLDELQLEGKRTLPGADFVRGQPDFIGARLR